MPHDASTDATIKATQMNLLRRIEGVNGLDRVRNVDIRERLTLK